MNVAEAIEKRVEELGWVAMTRFEKHHTKVNAWSDGERILRIYYKLYGSRGGQRLLQFYGRESADDNWINWGIESAEVDKLVRVHSKGVMIQRFEREHTFTGRNKRAQVMAWLKEQ